jgi:hypothetical protein
MLKLSSVEINYDSYGGAGMLGSGLFGTPRPPIKQYHSLKGV